MPLVPAPDRVYCPRCDYATVRSAFHYPGAECPACGGGRGKTEYKSDHVAKPYSDRPMKVPSK
jgi:uncharacterized protein (DUF983 family)